MTKFDKIRDEIKVLCMVWHYAYGQHLRLSIAMIFELLAGLFPPAIIYVLQYAIGSKAVHIESLLTQKNIIFLLLVYFCYMVLTRLSRIMTAFSIAEVEYVLRMQLVQSLRRMSYEEMKKIGLSSANGLTQEISMASGLIPMVYRSFIRATVTIVAFCALSLIISPHFFIIAFVLILAVLSSIVILRKRIKAIHQTLFSRISSLYQLFAEWLDGHRIFRVYGCMDFAVCRMQHVFLSIRDISRQLAVIANGQSVLVEIITYVMAAAIILLMPTEDGILNIGVLVSYPTAILFIRGESVILINGYQQLANTESSITRLFQILNCQSSTTETPGPITNIQRIIFDDVSFFYESTVGIHDILKNANLYVEKGKLNIIVGLSGIGKSTTLNLLLGLLHPQKGCARFESSSTLPQAAFHGIALVEQEPFIFEGTLYDNICMGRQGIDIHDIMYYINVLQLSSMFPSTDSLTENVEKYNRSLSSGEKQRIALVRALVGHPSVLVIDEVTSNIDQHTSSLIANFLSDLARQMLVIAVTHDPILIAKADAVHVLEDYHFTPVTTNDFNYLNCLN